MHIVEKYITNNTLKMLKNQRGDNAAKILRCSCKCTLIINTLGIPLKSYTKSTFYGIANFDPRLIDVYPTQSFTFWVLPYIVNYRLHTFSFNNNKIFINKRITFSVKYVIFISITKMHEILFAYTTANNVNFL